MIHHPVFTEFKKEILFASKLIQSAVDAGEVSSISQCTELIRLFDTALEKCEMYERGQITIDELADVLKQLKRISAYIRQDIGDQRINHRALISDLQDITLYIAHPARPMPVILRIKHNLAIESPYPIYPSYRSALTHIVENYLILN